MTELAGRLPHLPRMLAIALVASFAMAACQPASTATESEAVPSPSIASATPTPEPTPDLNETSALFDIGGGRELYLQCAGNGSPTILLEAGDESGVSDWNAVAPELLRNTRTCAYDRAGNGQSVDATGCRQLDDLLGDLEALLEVAQVEPPYLLVGASGGGYLMAGLAARRPADVAGLVLVETPKAITIMSPELEAAISCDAPTNVEHRDYYAVEHAVWDNRALIGEFPMTIISNDYGDAAPPGDEETNVEDQRGWLVLSPNSTQVVVTSGHDVTSNEPGLVVDEILAVLEAAQQP